MPENGDDAIGDDAVSEDAETLAEMVLVAMMPRRWR